MDDKLINEKAENFAMNLLKLADMAVPIESGQNLEFREDLMTSIKNVAIIAYTTGAKEVREYYNNQSIK